MIDTCVIVHVTLSLDHSQDVLKHDRVNTMHLLRQGLEEVRSHIDQSSLQAWLRRGTLCYHIVLVHVQTSLYAWILGQHFAHHCARAATHISDALISACKTKESQCTLLFVVSRV